MTWEDAVRELKEDSNQAALCRDCYYDDPLLEACQRYHLSDEWGAVRSVVGDGREKFAIDVGAGRGIGAYALACDGWKTVAIEPDPSALVGAKAIRSLGMQAIQVVRAVGENIPIANEKMDLCFARAVLHHASDLEKTLREIARVLKNGGKALLIREHVIDDSRSLGLFLEGHPLHRKYGGENAFQLEVYCNAIRKAGLKLIRMWGPFESSINYFPMTKQKFEQNVRDAMRRRLGWSAHMIPRFLAEYFYGWRWSKKQKLPGRLYSFLAIKQ